MGTTLRIFFIDEDDSLRRIPIARFDRLNQHNPSGRFPEYAGKLVRCATVAVTTLHRRPVEIIHMDYSIIGFDEEGFIDALRDRREMELARELLPLPMEEEPSHQVIDAKSRFLKKRYTHEFKWAPDREMVASIIAAVLPEENPVPF
jgi:hypothetical protein